MNVTKAVEIVAVMLAPTAAVAALILGSRALTRFARFRLERRARRHPVAPRAPIEMGAARLRRMLEHRETLLRSTGSAVRTHLVALEQAILEEACDLADAVDVRRPEVGPARPLPPGELPALLGRLVDAGIALPQSSLRR